MRGVNWTMHGSGSSVDGDAGKFADSIIVSGVPNRPEPGVLSYMGFFRSAVF